MRGDLESTKLGLVQFQLLRIGALYKLTRGGLESTRFVADRFRINRMGDYIILDYSLQSNISSTNLWSAPDCSSSNHFLTVDSPMTPSPYTMQMSRAV